MNKEKLNLVPGDTIYALVNYGITCDVIRKSIIQSIGNNIRIMIEEKDTSHSTYVIPLEQCFNSEEEGINYIVDLSNQFKVGDVYKDDYGTQYTITQTLTLMDTIQGTGYGINFKANDANNVIAFTRYKEVLKEKVS